MPRIKVVLNKTNTDKLNKFFKRASKKWPDIDHDDFKSQVTEQIKNEIRSLGKDCSEKMIVEHYIKHLDKMPIQTDLCACLEYINKEVKKQVRKDLAQIYTNRSFDNNIDIYFNEVKREYILHPQNECDELEFIPENRDVFIKNNLKLVVNCAKRYQNLGLPFEDLIQAGNEGLLFAFDKFKTDKANLRNAIIEEIQTGDRESYTYAEAEDVIKKAFTYGKLLDNTLKKLPKEGFDTKDSFVEWCKQNVKSAVFASVAFQWIRANIIIEISKMGQIIKLPKGFKEGDDNASNIARIIRLDGINPYTDDNYSDADLAVVSNEEFIIEDQALENVERQQTFISTVETLLSELDQTARQIIKKKYGIGYPYQMTIGEISESEGISVNGVKKILKESMFKLQETLTSEQKEMLVELL